MAKRVMIEQAENGYIVKTLDCGDDSQLAQGDKVVFTEPSDLREWLHRFFHGKDEANHEQE